MLLLDTGMCIIVAARIMRGLAAGARARRLTVAPIGRRAAVHRGQRLIVAATAAAAASHIVGTVAAGLAPSRRMAVAEAAARMRQRSRDT